MSIGAELQRFVALFVRWNQRINLSAARTVDEVTLHVVDCDCQPVIICFNPSPAIAPARDHGLDGLRNHP
jgi:hypothetical protein